MYVSPLPYMPFLLDNNQQQTYVYLLDRLALLDTYNKY